MGKEEFYTIDEMAEKLNVSKNEIYHRINQRQSGKAVPPFIKSGREVKFNKSEYEEWHNKLSNWRKHL